MMMAAKTLARMAPMMLVFCAAQVLAAERGEGLLQVASLGRCALDSGQFIEPCMLAYRTYGRLNADGSNAILFPTWYNGRSEDLKQFFGPDKLVDSTRFFGVAVDALGDGVSSSPSNSATQHGPRFPAITIRDMVRAEFRLATEALHLRHLHAVVGYSMGGMQAFEWMTDYPEFFDKAVPIAGTPRQTSYDLLNWDLLRRLIEADPGFDGGNYTVEPSLALANEFVALTVPSPAFTARTVSRAEFPQFLETSLNTQGGRDANDRLVQLQAMITQDVTRGGRSLRDAALKVHVSQLIVVATNDHLVNPAPALEWAHSIQAPTYISTGDCGHRIFICDGPALTARVRDFLNAP